MGNIIKRMNSKNLKLKTDVKGENMVLCNCRTKDNCSLNGLCHTERVVYCAKVKGENSSTKRYIGCTEGQFKRRWYNHTLSFRIPGTTQS